jgi:hypothetical protein
MLSFDSVTQHKAVMAAKCRFAEILETATDAQDAWRAPSSAPLHRDRGEHAG